MRKLLALALIFLGSTCSVTAQLIADPEKRVPEAPPEGPEGVPSYVIPRAATPVTIDGRPDDPAWMAADPIEFTFPWDDVSPEEAQTTTARVLYDQEALYVLYECEDPYLDAQVVERDGPVYQEDAVEIFASPNPVDVSVYFGFEMNIRGALLDYVAYEGGAERTPAEYMRFEWQSEGVEIETTYDGTLNDHSDIDNGWVLEAKIPFHNFLHYGASMPPQAGDMWRLNLNRTKGYGGQYCCWSDTRSEKPSFHHSAWFGKAYFSQRPPE